MEKEREGLREKLLRVLDLPADTLPEGWLLEVRGGRELTVRGCGSILTYTPEQIRLRLSSCVLVIDGSQLCCVAYHAEAVRVEGNIRQIGFEEADR